MEAGVPGVFIKIAEMFPEKIATFHNPISSTNPFAGGNQNVIGVIMAIPIVADRPGSAPITVPITTPRHKNNKTDGVQSSKKALAKISSVIHTPVYIYHLLNIELDGKAYDKGQIDKSDKHERIDDIEFPRTLKYKIKKNHKRKRPQNK